MNMFHLSPPAFFLFVSSHPFSVTSKHHHEAGRYLGRHSEWEMLLNLLSLIVEANESWRKDEKNGIALPLMTMGSQREGGKKTKNNCIWWLNLSVENFEPVINLVRGVLCKAIGVDGWRLEWMAINFREVLDNPNNECVSLSNWGRMNTRSNRTICLRKFKASYAHHFPILCRCHRISQRYNFIVISQQIL